MNLKKNVDLLLRDPRGFARKVSRSVAWRLAHDTEKVVLFAGPLAEAPARPPDVDLWRIAASDDPRLDTLRTALRAAEETDPPEAQFGRGEVLVGWAHDGA